MQQNYKRTPMSKCETMATMAQQNEEVMLKNT